MTGPVVETGYGKVRGTTTGATMVFRGIPFAAPPTGKLRFRASEPPTPWAGERDATAFGPSAMQMALPTILPGGYTFHHGLPASDEDCLTLNVWTPACDGAKRPVMVWIHGGAFLAGAGSEALYEGRRMSELGDVVVVTVNYRLGALGFLNLGDGEHGPNQAVQDWLLALTWVRDNIDAFGGDADNVTLFGESAGAIAVSALIGVPSARPLFHKIIGQSGSGRPVVGVDHTIETAEIFRGHLGVGAGEVDAILEAPAQELLNATFMTFAVSQFKRDTITGGFEPCIDGVVLTENPLAAVRAGAMKDIPILVGSTRDEMTLTRAATPDFATLDEAGLEAKVVEAVGPDGARIAAAYREANPGLSMGEVWEHLLNGREMRMPSVRLAEAQAAAGGAAYNYIFCWDSPDPDLGATHGIDLGFTFGNFADIPAHDQYGGIGPAAEAFAGEVMDRWIAFARTGDPSIDGSAWPRYDAERRPTMLLGAESTVADDPDRAERLAWEA